MQIDLVFVGVLLRRPIVVPFPRRQEHSLSIESLRDYWRHKKIGAEKKIAIVAVKFRGLRILQEDGTHKRYPRPRGFFCICIDVRQQFVTQLDVFPSNRFLFRTVHPGLVVQSAFCSVIAVNGIEDSDLVPAR